MTRPRPGVPYFFNTHRQRVDAVLRDAAGKRVFRRLCTFAEAHLDAQGDPLPDWSDAERDAYLTPRYLAAERALAQEALEPRIAQRVEELARDRMASMETSRPRRDSIRMFHRREATAGLIYVVDIAGSRKVGLTHQPTVWRRIAQYEHAHGPGVDVHLRAVWQVHDAAAVEFEIHQSLESHRIRGEWYQPSAEVLATVERIVLARGGERGRVRPT